MIIKLQPLSYPQQRCDQEMYMTQILINVLLDQRQVINSSACLSVTNKPDYGNFIGQKKVSIAPLLK